MQRFILILSVFVINATVLFGQNTNEFAGTWTLDKETSFSKKSERDQYSYYYLTLTFEGKKLTIKKDFEVGNTKSNYETILFADKRGERNLMPDGRSGRSEVASKTRWKNNAIIREYSRQRDIAFMSQLEQTTEKYSLSDDGQRLVVTVTTTVEIIPRDPRTKTMGNLDFPTFKLVFRRQ